MAYINMYSHDVYCLYVKIARGGGGGVLQFVFEYLTVLICHNDSTLIPKRIAELGCLLSLFQVKLFLHFNF